MMVRPSEVMFMTDDYVLVEPNADMVFNEEIVWTILDEEDKKIYNDWFN